MSIAKVKEYLRDYGRDCDVQEFPVSSATVELAAKALSVEPARIAKTLSFHGDETNGCILIVTAGDMKIDNARFKKQFGFKARMPVSYTHLDVYKRQAYGLRGLKRPSIKGG